MTDDGRTWRPCGRRWPVTIAYLHTEGQIVDLRMHSSRGSADGTVGDRSS